MHGESRILHGNEDTRQLGAAYTEHTGLLFLEGDLGAGKTTFVAGLLSALGFSGAVTSPTYSLMHLYPTPRGMVLHIDAYRISSANELYEMGLDDYLIECRLVLVEWGQKLYEDFPEAPRLCFSYRDDIETRGVSAVFAASD